MSLQKLQPHGAYPNVTNKQQYMLNAIIVNQNFAVEAEKGAIKNKTGKQGGHGTRGQRVNF